MNVGIFALITVYTFFRVNEILIICPIWEVTKCSSNAFEAIEKLI